MKVRDQQGALKLKFLKSLERIEKKLEMEETQVRRRVREPMGEEVGRGVVADILVSPKDVLIVRHTVVQARPLPENIENMERRN